jgi:hypothetical protein
MYILEMMKKDPKSVIGLTVGVEINGVPNAVVGVVKDAEVKNYSWAISEDDIKTDVPRYIITFNEIHFYNVDRFTCGYAL